MSFRSSPRRWTGAVTFALLAAGCGGDPVAVNVVTTPVLADLAQVTTAFDSNATFVALSPTLLRIAPFSPPFTAGPVIPVLSRGRTWAWNSTALHYQVDTAATGSPATGVRIRLYRLNPDNLDMPAVPLDSIGHVDLLDLTTPSLDRLRILVTGGAGTTGDYQISGARTMTGASFDVAGFLQAANGTRHVTFTGSWTSNANGTSAQAHLVLPAGITLDYTQAIQPDGDETATMTLASADRVVVATFADNGIHATGTIRFDGAQVATYTWDGVTPIVTAAGASLTSPQIADLRELLVRGFQLGVVNLQQLLTPGHHLF